MTDNRDLCDSNFLPSIALQKLALGKKELWTHRAKHNQWDAKRIKLARTLQAESPRVQT